MSEVCREFGAIVRAHRLRLGFSQGHLAERAALHRTYITDVERGARNLSLESMQRVARALDVPLSALFKAWPNGNNAPRSSAAVKSSAAEILLVEDDLQHVKLALTAFKQIRLVNRVKVVHDGETALDFLFGQGRFAGRKKGTRPIIVLLDLDLPKLTGLEVLKRVRADKRTNPVPVAVLTPSHAVADLRAALRLGANACAVKPLDLPALTSIVSKLNFSWTLLNGNGQSLSPARRKSC